MKVNIKIVSFVCTLMALISASSWGQNLPSACGGSRVRYGVSGTPSSNFNWEVSGGTIVQNYNDSIDVEWGLSSGIKTIRVTEYTKDNCVAAPVLANVLITTTNVDIGTIAEICEGDSFTFVPNAIFALYNWSTGATTSQIVTGNAGTYWVDITDANGCKSRDSATLVVNPKLVINLGDDTTLCPDQTLVLDAGFDGTKYNWSTGDISQTLQIGAGNTTYWVDVTSDKNCVTRDSISISLCVDLKIPNAFTPNGDNDNDTWNIRWMEFYPDASIDIYDRWGRVVFKRKGFPVEGWDGKSNGRPLPMDSYHYIIDLKNGTDPIVGNVTIIR
jgi:gliding motility-associated-like protein